MKRNGVVNNPGYGTLISDNQCIWAIKRLSSASFRRFGSNSPSGVQKSIATCRIDRALERDAAIFTGPFKRNMYNFHTWHAFVNEKFMTIFPSNRGGILAT
jgi:hypothetical protein